MFPRKPVWHVYGQTEMISTAAALGECAHAYIKEKAATLSPGKKRGGGTIRICRRADP